METNSTRTESRKKTTEIELAVLRHLIEKSRLDTTQEMPALDTAILCSECAS